MKTVYRIFVLVLLAVSPMLASAQSARTHTVLRGQTFQSVARMYGITVQELKDANPGEDDCYVGMKLTIPDKQPPATPKPAVTTTHASQTTAAASAQRRTSSGSTATASNTQRSVSSTSNSNNSSKTKVYTNKDGSHTIISEQKCFSCNGVGTPTCQVCGGLGWQAGAYGPMTCSMCAGKGKVICFICHGSGKNVWVGDTRGGNSNTQQSTSTSNNSNKANTTIQKQSKSTTHTRDCVVCSGTGMCGGGYQLNHCAGTGTCNFCVGRGRQGFASDERPCPCCDGKLSNGWGNGKCSFCHGTGKCQTCNGTGKKTY